jgi:hypothetical protein
MIQLILTRDAFPRRPGAKSVSSSLKAAAVEKFKPGSVQYGNPGTAASLKICKKKEELEITAIQQRNQ